MKRIRYGAILFFACLLFVACGKEEDSSLRTYSVYYLDYDMTQLVKEEYQSGREESDVKGLAGELVKAMRRSEDAKNKSALGDDVEITDIQYKESQLSVYFSASYNGRTGTEEILSRAAIVQTLCEIRGVEYVDFYVEDQPLMIAGAAVGLMSKQSFISDLNETQSEHTKQIVLYFSNKNGNALKPVKTTVNYDSAIPLAKLLVEKLIQGEDTIAKTKRGEEVIPTIPGDTVLNNLTIRDNICYLDFSKNINDFMKGIRSDVVVYAIVNTLCELSDINRVQITVEGEPQQRYGEMEGFHLVLERKLELIQE